VTAPTTGTEATRITYTEKEQLEKACLNKAQQWLTQAAKTPMLQAPMREILGTTNLQAPAFQQSFGWYIPLSINLQQIHVQTAETAS